MPCPDIVITARNALREAGTMRKLSDMIGEEFDFKLPNLQELDKETRGGRTFGCVSIYIHEMKNKNMVAHLSCFCCLLLFFFFGFLWLFFCFFYSSILNSPPDTQKTHARRISLCSPSTAFVLKFTQCAPCACICLSPRLLCAPPSFFLPYSL